MDQGINEMLEFCLEHLPRWKTGTVEFVKSLRDQYELQGELTDRQIEALERIYRELEEKR